MNKISADDAKEVLKTYNNLRKSRTFHDLVKIENRLEGLEKQNELLIDRLEEVTGFLCKLTNHELKENVKKKFDEVLEDE